MTTFLCLLFTIERLLKRDVRSVRHLFSIRQKAGDKFAGLIRGKGKPTTVPRLVTPFGSSRLVLPAGGKTRLLYWLRHQARHFDDSQIFFEDLGLRIVTKAGELEVQSTSAF